MNRRWCVFAFGLGTLGVLYCGPIWAQEDRGGRPKEQGEQQGQTDPAEVWAKVGQLAEPGEHHGHLKPLVGTFATTVKMWMAPGGEPMQSTGLIERRWVLGGRYLIEEYKSDDEQMPFEGMGIMTYDNGQKQYSTVWMDSMSTTIYTQTGACDASGKKFTFTGNNFDPRHGEKKWGKATLEIVNDDKHILRMFEKGPDGKEFMSFEMIETRK